jgi:hypothetical protein
MLLRMRPSLQEKPMWKDQPSQATQLPSTLKEGPSGCTTSRGFMLVRRGEGARERWKLEFWAGTCHP